MQVPLRKLNRGDYKTLSLSALGGALEFYDFIIFVFFATVLGALFFPPDTPEWLRQLQTFGIFAAGYLIRPVGGLVMAHFGDQLGRKRMFTLSILLMALPTLAMGFLPTYAQIGLAAPLLLLLLRLLQGAAIGGEVPGAWVFVAEHVPAKRMGLACSILTAGLTLGILLGSLAASVINRIFSPEEIAEYAWRIPFVVGGVFGLLAVYLRRHLSETPVFAEMAKTHQLAKELPLKQVIREHKLGVAVSMLVTWVLSAAVVVVILMTPTLLQNQYGFSALEALGANALAIVLASVGCVLAGLAADRFGLGWVYSVGGLLMLVSSLSFYRLIGAHPDYLLALYGFAGLGIGVLGAVPLVMVRAFKAPVRFSGLSFSYNLAYAICGGFTPILVSVLSSQSPLGPGLYVACLSVLMLALGVWLKVTGRFSQPL